MFGIGILFPFVRSVEDRDTMVNTVAPVWDGNGTWLVLGGASLLAASPLAYSVLLSALCIPLVLMLAGLIWRGVAFEFRFIFTAVGLLAGYALLGSTWLILKTEGGLQRRMIGLAGPITLAVLIGIGMVSVWTPLTS